ncbi:MAG: 2-amino-4-hydroxy-6-hydroxymethyldihydropteridine diphosphokinase [Deltaproteobacteria bacterium HGW-Deltaproteobacteria-13]|jgi:2-amino-4-hydroxy-6-hydroxymethyldihydropteridine diphosphokinase|nr:MAG: 2-amino-4-hydroxy-6-hydroxymethyldihydropteridine diphosphokinase [Deltaproteobacteria bacterium HGW-Deltaproteobacteria-13]
MLCYIGVGSNLGDSLKNCRGAIEGLSGIVGIELTTVSSFYKTEPVGMENQNYFINAVIEIKTTLTAQKLFEAMQNIENTMGRQRGAKGGPRIIDLDLLFYGQNVIHEQNLIVPHPEIHKRRFVLEPLSEIASYFIHPSFGLSIRGLKDRLSDNKKVEKIKE